tara:strand:- start:195 stop:938 length:744 start_codon:yes stop_codon:yes gene_type:complete
MPFIIARRPEIQNGSVQITDLFPNVSQRNLVNDPQGQGPFYVRIPDLGKTGTYRTIIKTNADGSYEFLREARGLVAYLIANVEADPVNNGGAGPALTIAQATTAADNILARVRAGSTLAIGDINGILSAADVVNAGTDLDGGTVVGSNSTGSLTELLSILAGETYSVNGGVAIQDAAGAKALVAHAALGSSMRTLVTNDSSWKISFSEGSLQGLTTVRDAVKGDLFAGVLSTSPLLTVYNDDGSLYS